MMCFHSLLCFLSVLPKADELSTKSIRMITYNNSLINSKLQHPSLSPPPPPLHKLPAFEHCLLLGDGEFGPCLGRAFKCNCGKEGGGDLNEPTFQTNSITV